jgi:hypothetical protein
VRAHRLRVGDASVFSYAPQVGHEHAPSTGRARDRAARASLQREKQRLLRAFAALLAAAAPAAALGACGEPARSGPDRDAGAEVSDAAAPAEDAAHDAAAHDGAHDAAPPGDGASDKSCLMQSHLLDGSDEEGEPICLFTLPCGLDPQLVPQGCNVYSVMDDAATPIGCTLVEGEGCMADVYVPPDGGQVSLLCPGCLGGGGRRPRGLVRARGRAHSTALGAYFGGMAYEEAASVHAFLRLGEELARHGAPAPLVRAAERSARDEERHARLMARWARAYGVTAPAPKVRRARPRTLEAMARENAVEGCAHETFGALLLGWQAARSPDPSLRRAFARVAADEARHAALAWAVAAWAEGRLDARGRARVGAARARALGALGRAQGPSPFDGAVGRPSPADRAALLAGLIERLGLA